ncbi:MAG: hypothetical protein R3F43_32375 [bacterium]
MLGVRPRRCWPRRRRRCAAAGVPTPQIAAWVPRRPGRRTWRTAGRGRPSSRASTATQPYADLILRDRQGRMILFAVDHGGLPADAGQIAQAEAAGDVVVVRLWGLLAPNQLAGGQAAWMQPCEAPGPPKRRLTFTTLVSPQNPCGQRATPASPIGSMLSVSASYQLGYASLPFQSTGRGGGLTLRRQFATACAAARLAAHQLVERAHRPAPERRQRGRLATWAAAWAWRPAARAASGLGRHLRRGVLARHRAHHPEHGDGMYRLMASCLRVYRPAATPRRRGLLRGRGSTPWSGVCASRIAPTP